MAAETEITVDGKTVRLAYGIGFIDDVSKIESRPQVLMARFGGTDWEIGDLKAVLASALKWGGSSMTPDALINDVGLQRAYNLAAGCLMGSWHHEAFEGEAPGEPETTSDGT